MGSCIRTPDSGSSAFPVSCGKKGFGADGDIEGRALNRGDGASD